MKISKDFFFIIKLISGIVIIFAISIIIIFKYPYGPGLAALRGLEWLVYAGGLTALILILLGVIAVFNYINRRRKT